ncbi:MaoC family dehydratase [Chelatococcus asaccharovorans]|uniref:Acyl dehydratase n=1 Tax=Chelatococcus asaccharovorans TaxID=28210 RepID=A0A2V3TSU5_9HYPH|nr:MaoC family dehydratase [Chelatococcus asaccharovorans]MBS7707985.1 MaoC family dehydratase [Chelatococcus asaccharovorans]PXW50539.1 acyl dehydratase [Chelatococcus asaccharovorans]
MSKKTSGRYFEELVIGEVYRHAITRTVTETDNLLFTALTHNTQPLHLDEAFSQTSMYGSRVVNSIFTLGLAVGVGVTELTLGTTLGNLGFGSISFPNPVRIGDTLRAETEVVGKRDSKSRPDAGVVEFETRGFNQEGKLVVTARRLALMKKANDPGIA